MGVAIEIIKHIAANNYDVSEDESTSDSVAIVHKRCGHKFYRDTKYIGFHGIRCPRCDSSATLTDEIKNGITETKSLNLYKACKEVLPDGFSLVGDTSNEECVVKIRSPLGGEYSVRIRDLLDNTNLPDCLLRRDAEIHSIQLDILDMIAPANWLVLDNFETLDDVIRVKSQTKLFITEIKVRDFIKGELNE